MRLFDISLSSLRRRAGRMMLLIVGLAVGVATVVALTAITETMQADVATKLDEYGANILVAPKSSDLALSYGGITIGSTAYDVGELTFDDLERIGQIENARNISVLAPKLLVAVPLRGRTVLMAGVLFPDEIRLKRWWQVRGEYPALPDEALVGARLAQALGLQPGATIQVLERSLRIVGVLEENTSQDDDILFVDLAVSQALTSKPARISVIEVAALCTECPIEDIVAQISRALPQARVSALRQAVTLRMETVERLSRFAITISVVVILIGVLIVLTTMLGAVAERRQEIGLFRALGFRQRHVEQVILSETAMVSLAGGFLGWLLGMMAAIWLSPALAGASAPVVWDARLALGAVGGALLIGLAGSVYPAFQAARLDPTIALRSL